MMGLGCYGGFIVLKGCLDPFSLNDVLLLFWFKMCPDSYNARENHFQHIHECLLSITFHDPMRLVLRLQTLKKKKKNTPDLSGFKSISLIRVTWWSGLSFLKIKRLEFNSISVSNCLCVMGNFMHQLGWASMPRYVVKHYSGYIYVCVSGWD